MPDSTTPSAIASHRTLWYVGTVLLLISGSVLFFAGPGEGSPCLIRAATGVACPGCGMTRATEALLRGNWDAMWRFHPLASFFAIQAAVVWALWGWAVFVRRALVNETWLLGLFAGDFALLALVWVVRFFAGRLPP